MKAAIYKEYGPPGVVHVAETPLPEAKDNEVRVRVHATTVSSADSRMRAMRIPKGFRLISRLIFGITKPRKHILGSEFAGTIDAIGPEAKQFAIGDKVFGANEARGAHAEYFTMKESEAIEHLPESLTFKEAAALPFGGLTSLIFLKHLGDIQAGQKVLVIGASGALGTAAIQLATHYGADVAGVCSTPNVELVKSLGASKVIDYKTSHFADEGEQYDLIYETVGIESFSECKKALKPGGIVLMAGPTISDYFRMLLNPVAGNKRLIAGVAIFKKKELTELRELIEIKAIRPVIDSTYTLEEIPEAHARVDTGRKRGSVVVSIA